MPNGTNEQITDSIINTIERKAKQANQEFTNEFLSNTDKILFQNIVKNIGPGSSKGSLIINLLPGENRPTNLSSTIVANRIQELVGDVIGVESLVFGSGGNFGGSPVSVSLLGNNIKELKAAKKELRTILENNPALKDIMDNDPLGIKEIRLELKDNAYILGLDYRSVMSQVRAGFFGAEAQRFQRSQDEIRIWVRYDRQNRSSINDLDQMRILTPTGNR